MGVADTLAQPLEAFSDSNADRYCHLADESEPDVPRPVPRPPGATSCLLVFEIFERTGEWEGV